jgi:hypothetical protein
MEEDKNHFGKKVIKEKGSLILLAAVNLPKKSMMQLKRK